jgi:FkbM family methyltransferase
VTPEKNDKVSGVGANVGVFSLWAARRGATVTAYEPGPKAFDHLAANTRNAAVTPIHAAVVGTAPADGVVRLFLHEKSTHNTLANREITGDPFSSFAAVPAVEIDDVLVTGCELLKVDCEGAEFETLAAARDHSLRQVRRMIIALHGAAGDPQTLLDGQTEAGFDAAIVHGAFPDGPFGVIAASRDGV